MLYLLVSRTHKGHDDLQISRSTHNFYAFESKARGDIYVVGIPESPSEFPSEPRPISVVERERIRQAAATRSSGGLKRVFEVMEMTG